jgi:hypothetical protein
VHRCASQTRHTQCPWSGHCNRRARESTHRATDSVSKVQDMQCGGFLAVERSQRVTAILKQTNAVPKEPQLQDADDTQPAVQPNNQCKPAAGDATLLLSLKEARASLRFSNTYAVPWSGHCKKLTSYGSSLSTVNTSATHCPQCQTAAHHPSHAARQITNQGYKADCHTSCQSGAAVLEGARRLKR